MFQTIYEELSREISGENARNMAGDIWRYDRTCSFSEYYKSARYCCEKLKDAGAKQVKIISFPADGKTKYGALTIQRAWDCKDAELRIVEPEGSAARIASYRDEPYSLAQGSPPTPKRGVEAEVVVVNGGSKPADYKGVKVRGKIILTSQAVGAVHELAAKRGAVGLVSDFMATNPVTRPTPMDLPDAVLWQTMRPEGKCFGFVLSPRQGKRLRDLIAAEEKKKKAVKLHARVHSRLYAGKSEMVSAAIEGQSPDQEVALIAHLYEPGANDNASGAALCIEIVRSLNALTTAKKLPRPKRTIRVLLTHEFQSLNAHAIANKDEMDRIVAAANVDFVGQDQALCGSTLMYQTGPDSLPSFINHLMNALMDYFQSRFHSSANNSPEPYFNIQSTPFWMNDNFISDPSIGCPSVALINWPDKFYHTSFDTEDKIDPASFRRVGVLAGAFVYSIANAGVKEAHYFAETVAESTDKIVGDFVRKTLSESSDVFKWLREEKNDKAAENQKKSGEEKSSTAPADSLDKIAYLRDRQKVALESVAQLVRASQARPRESEQLKAHIAELAKDIDAAAVHWQNTFKRRASLYASVLHSDTDADKKRSRMTALEKKAAAIIPMRKIRGIINTKDFPKKVKDGLERLNKKGMPRLLAYWVDGERSALDIYRLAKHEGDGGAADLRRIVRWCELMVEAGVLETKDA